MKNLWEQQNQESDKAYQRFCQYRDMGPKRSIRLLAEECELHRSTLGEMSTKYSWPDRVKAFDNFIERSSQLSTVSQVKSMKRRHIFIALRAQQIAAKALTHILRNLKDEEQLSKFRPDALVKILEFGCKLERINRDEPEQRIELYQKYDYDKLSLEECEHLHKLVKKAAGGS